MQANLFAPQPESSSANCVTARSPAPSEEDGNNQNRTPAIGRPGSVHSETQHRKATRIRLPRCGSAASLQHRWNDPDLLPDVPGVLMAFHRMIQHWTYPPDPAATSPWEHPEILFLVAGLTYVGLPRTSRRVHRGQRKRGLRSGRLCRPQLLGVVLCECVVSHATHLSSSKHADRAALLIIYDLYDPLVFYERSITQVEDLQCEYVRA